MHALLKVHAEVEIVGSTFPVCFPYLLQQSTGRLTTNVHLRLVLYLYMYDYYQSSSDYG